MDITGTSRFKKNFKKVINQDKKIIEIYLYKAIQEYRQIFGHKILDYREISKKTNIKITTIKHNFFSNLIEFDGIKKEIFINENTPEEYKKFYIMYKIAFILLLDYVKEYQKINPMEHVNINIIPKIIFKSNSDQVIEELCCNFAFEALLPLEVLKRFLENNESLKEIAKYFCISEEIIQKYIEQKQLMYQPSQYSIYLPKKLQKNKYINT